jgi:hypothetical protein
MSSAPVIEKEESVLLMPRKRGMLKCSCYMAGHKMLGCFQSTSKGLTKYVFMVCEDYSSVYIACG